MGLVAVEAAVARLVAVAGLGINGRDDPVLGHAPHDAKDAVVARLCVLAGDQGQQVGGPHCAGGERLFVQGLEGGHGVADQGVDQGFARRLVVPVARRLADGGVLVVAQQGGADRPGQWAAGLIEGGEQLADGGAQLGDGVLGGHGVMQWSRVEDPGPVLERPGLFGHHLGVFEETSWACRGAQAVALTHERGRMERLVAGIDPGGRLPTQVKAETVGGLGVAQALEGLEEHHRRHHPGRNGRSPPHRLLVEIGEVVVPEELVAVIGQEPIDRTLLQPIAEDLPRVLEALLDLRPTECHASNSGRPGDKSRAFVCDYFRAVLDAVRSRLGSPSAERP